MNIRKGEPMSYFENLNPNQMLHMMGLKRETQTTMLTDTVLPALAVFSTGILVGAAIALLVTPKTGRELRQDLSRKANELTDTVRSQIPALRSDNVTDQAYADRTSNPNPGI